MKYEQKVTGRIWNELMGGKTMNFLKMIERFEEEVN